MTPEPADILSLVTESLIQLRKDLALPELNEISSGTVLYGSDGDLDSMAIVHLVVDIEARLQQAYAKSWILADERALSLRRSPFRTIESLCKFIITSTPEAS